MELRHLRYFAAVAETCHFSRAADRLRVAQPALSQAVRQLETELGTSLFQRTTRHVALTSAGEFFLAETRRILDTVDSGVRGVRKIADGRHGLVRLGLTGIAVYSHLPWIAQALKKELPGIALEIHADLLTPTQCDRLRDGTLDLAVLRPPAVGDGIELRTFVTEQLVVALPTTHPLAAERIVALARLESEDFITYAARRSAVNETVHRACRAAGFVPRSAHAVQSTAVLLALVAAGLGLAVMPAGVRAVPLEGVVFRDLQDAGAMNLALAWRSDENSATVPAVVGVVEAGLRTSDPAEGHA